MFILASITNYVIQTTMIETAEKFKFNSFAETTSYLNHLTVVKLIPLFFVMLGFKKCISNLTSMSETINHLITVFGGNIDFLVYKKSFIWIVTIPLIFVYLLYKKQTNFFKFFYFSSIFSIFAIITFLAVELYKGSKADTLPKGEHKLVNWSELVGTYFYMLATTSLKGQLFSIYKGLVIKNSQFMKKFISISLVFCWIIYPIYAGLGYFLYRENKSVTDGKGFIEAYYSENLKKTNVIFIIVLILRFTVNLTIFLTNVLTVRGFISKYMNVKPNPKMDSLKPKIERVNKKINIFVHLTTIFLLITLTSLFIYRGKSVSTITLFNVAFIFPMVYSIIPLKIRYRYEKTFKIKILFFILLVAYFVGIIFYLSKL